ERKAEEMAAKPCTVLITGANRGLGLEMVKQMVEGSHPVKKLFACCRDPDGPRAEALKALTKRHPNICIVKLDASDPCSIKECAKQVTSLVGAGGLNLLINNAGYLARSIVQEATPEDMQKSFNTNVTGPLIIIKEFLPLLRAAVKASKAEGMSCCKASVVNISSLLGSMSVVKNTYHLLTAAPYRISKAGLNMLTLCAAEELKTDKILFVVLHPGWVRTEMGGEEGEIDTQESVQGMIRVMGSLTEKQNGAFLDYKGQTIAW
ncbi:hypothetical protein L3Q82_014107, partial [Scortum barcoo]